MPDRRLTLEEMRQFLRESSDRKLGFKALEAFGRENREPTLHDLCISELNAKAEALKDLLIEQGRQINALKRFLKVEEKEGPP